MIVPRQRPCRRCGAYVDFTPDAPERHVLCAECFALEVLLIAPAGSIKLAKAPDGEIVIEGLGLRHG